MNVCKYTFNYGEINQVTSTDVDKASKATLIVREDLADGS
jgi:hypothetical protein